MLVPPGTGHCPAGNAFQQGGYANTKPPRAIQAARVEAVELVPHRLHLPCRRLKWDVELTDEPGRSELDPHVGIKVLR